jgi:predicted secreted Zn-dependent protease
MIPKQGTISKKTYAVKGDTLEAINTMMEKVGPKDPNASRRYSGSCLGEIAIAIGGNDFDFETTPNKTPVEVTATLKAGTATSNSIITTPKLATEKALSPDALKEWKRFLVKVLLHENGHADSYYDLAVDIAKEFNALSAKGTGKDERAAQVAAQKALIDLISKTYTVAELSARVKADAREYDKKTDHGAKQGAVLDTSIT